MARRFLALKTISPLFALLMLSCSPAEKRDSMNAATVQKSADVPLRPNVKEQEADSVHVEEFLGLWSGLSTQDTLLVENSEVGLSVLWKSNLDGGIPHLIQCREVDGFFLGEYNGQGENVIVRAADGRLFLTIDPHDAFDLIKDQEFQRVILPEMAEYIKPSEELIYAFDMEDGLHLSLAKASDDSYLVYRYGTQEDIQLEFPKDLSKSWSSFTYSHYLKGGGLENEGLEENLLRFNIGDLAYTVQDVYYAPEDWYYPALSISNESTGEEVELRGRPKSMKGSLIRLRDYEQLREDPVENIAWIGRNDMASNVPDDRLMLQESLGELRYDMRPSQVREQVGQPDRVQAGKESPMDGHYHTYWFYDALGLKVELVSASEDATGMKVEVIMIQGDSPLVTDRWIGIGSSRDDVIEAYPKELERNVTENAGMLSSPDSNVLVIGELGGIRFKLQEEKVVEIILGRLTGS